MLILLHSEQPKNFGCSECNRVKFWLSKEINRKSSKIGKKIDMYPYTSNNNNYDFGKFHHTSFAILVVSVPNQTMIAIACSE